MSGCAHPKHPAITMDGSYCCEDATKAISHDLYYEPLQRDGRQLHYEAQFAEVVYSAPRPKLFVEGPK